MDMANALQLLIENKNVFIVMLLGYIAHWLPYALKDKLQKLFIDSHFTLKVVIVVIVSILCYQTYAADFQPFIYFQF